MATFIGLFIGLAIFICIICVYLYSKITQRRMKGSRYGHTFDFSKMPNKKIKPKDANAG